MTNEWSSSREDRALDPCLEKNKLLRNVSLIELLNVVSVKLCRLSETQFLADRTK